MIILRISWKTILKNYDIFVEYLYILFMFTIKPDSKLVTFSIYIFPKKHIIFKIHKLIIKKVQP